MVYGMGMILCLGQAQSQLCTILTSQYVARLMGYYRVCGLGSVQRGPGVLGVRFEGDKLCVVTQPAVPGGSFALLQDMTLMLLFGQARFSNGVVWESQCMARLMAYYQVWGLQE